MEIKEAQGVVKEFSERNGWEDFPNIDKIDHLHEELVEVSQYLRYKNKEERIKFVKDNKDLFTNEIGDIMFGLCRLSNQLGVDLTEGFEKTKDKAFEKYRGKKSEVNIIDKKSLGNNNDN